MRTLPLLAFAVSMLLHDTPAYAAQAKSSGHVLRNPGLTNGAASSLSASYRLLGSVRNDGAANGKGALYALRDRTRSYAMPCSGAVGISEVQSATRMFLGLDAPTSCVDLDASDAVSIYEVQRVINRFLGM